MLRCSVSAGGSLDGAPGKGGMPANALSHRRHAPAAPVEHALFLLGRAPGYEWCGRECIPKQQTDMTARPPFPFSAIVLSATVGIVKRICGLCFLHIRAQNCRSFSACMIRFDAS